MQNPNTISGDQPQDGQTRTRRHLLPREITTDPAFQFRHTGTDKGHVRGLVQMLRTVGDLDPILVWQEVGADGQPTGRLVLLDGGQRLAAYATARPRSGIPAVVLQGDRAGAMLAAVQANSKESLPLTKNERMDAAWRLVRLPGDRLKVNTIAQASAVAPRSVDSMRERWRAMQADGKEPTGHWWRDRKDDKPEMKDRPEMTDEQRRAAVAQAAEVLRRAFGKLPWQDQEIAAEALQLAVGTFKLRTMVEWLYGDDEFGDGQKGHFADTIRGPEEGAEGRDF